MIKKTSFFKRIVLSLALFSLCSISFAGGVELAPVKPSYDGFSILGGFGGVWMRPVNMYIETINLDTGLYLDQTLKLPTGAYEMAPFARAGLEWGHAFNDFYLGLNVNFLTGVYWSRIFDITTGIHNTGGGLVSQTSGYEVVRQNYAVNALMKLGYLYQQWLFYFQLGAAASNVTIWQPSLELPNATVPYRWVPGGAAGVGFEVVLAPSFILGADYLLTYYGSASHPIDWAVQQPPDGTARDDLLGILNTKFFTQRVGVYLKYIF